MSYKFHRILFLIFSLLFLNSNLKAQSYEIYDYDLDSLIGTSFTTPLGSNSIIQSFDEVDSSDYLFSVNVEDSGVISKKYFDLIEKSTLPTGFLKLEAYDNTKTLTGTVIRGENILADDVNGYFIGLSVNGGAGNQIWLEGGALENGAADTSNSTIFGDNVIIKNVNADFIGNYLESSVTSLGQGGGFGGAILNGGTIENLTGSFVGNYVYDANNGVTNGGAIINASNWGEGIINNLNANFIGNYTYSTLGQAGGGGILNGTRTTFSGYGFDRAYIENINGDFLSNYAYGGTGAYGGAINNFSVIANYTSLIDKITGNFIGNYVQTNTGNALGGAVYNSSSDGVAEIDLIDADFIGNYAISESGWALGGAIHNSFFTINAETASINTITGDFIGNYTKSNTNFAFGGVLYNADSFIRFVDSNFFDNYAISGEKAWGGAIYTNDKLGGKNTQTTIIAKEDDVYFSGNYTDNKGVIDYNAFYLNNSDLFLTASDGKSIILNDDLDSSSIINTIVIQNYVDLNDISNNVDGSGTIVFNDLISDVSIDLNSGNLVLGRENQYTDSSCTGVGCRSDLDIGNSSLFYNVNLDISDEAILNTQNNVIQTTNINQLTLADTETSPSRSYSMSGFSIDIDYAGGTNISSDVFNVTNLSNSDGWVYFDDINLYGSGSWVDGTTLSTKVFNVQNSNTINIFEHVFFNSNGEYTITDAGNGNINIAYEFMIPDLENVIADDSVYDRTYDITTDENIDTDFGTLSSGNVVANGNNNSIIGNGTSSGLIVNSGQQFTFNNVASVSGFNGDAFNTSGTVNVNSQTTGTTFDDLVSVNSSGLLNLNPASGNTIEFLSGISGGGSVDKYDLGSVEINQNTSQFFGIFNQNSGSVDLTSSITDGFGGDYNMENGTLNLTTNIVNGFSGDLNVGGGDVSISSSVADGFNGNLNLVSGDVDFTGSVANGFSGSMNLSGGNLNIDSSVTDAFSGDISLNGGTINLIGSNDYFLEGASLNVSSGLVNIANSSISSNPINLGNLNLIGNLDLGIDVNLSTEEADEITANVITRGSGVILIEDINVLEDSVGESATVNVSNDADIQNLLSLSPSLVLDGNLLRYNVSYIGSGNLLFNRFSGSTPFDYNPSSYASSIALQAGLFDSVIKNNNLTFDKTEAFCGAFCKSRDFFLSTYYDDKTISFDNYYDVDAKTYGLVLGVNTSTYYYNGISRVYGFLISSNNGEYEWEDQKLDQNGFNIAFNTSFSDEDTFLNLSVGFGYSEFDLEDNSFDGYNLNVGARFGYNFYLADRIIFVPSVRGTYAYIDLSNYVSTAGINMKTSDASGFQLSPELKLKMMTSDDSGIYTKASFNINKFEGGEIDASGTNLPSIEEKNYSTYSLGFEKEFSSFWYGYLESSLIEDGKSGFGVNLGLEMTF